MAPARQFSSVSLDSLTYPSAANARASGPALSILQAILKQRHDELRLELIEASLRARSGNRNVAAKEWSGASPRDAEMATRTLIGDIIAPRRKSQGVG